MKKVISLISLIVIVIIAITFGVSQANTVDDVDEIEPDTTIYTLQQALSTDDYTARVDVEEKSLTISTKRWDENYETQDSKELVLSEETEKTLINQMLQWELVKYGEINLTKSLISDSHYGAYLTVSTGYRLYLDSVDNTVSIVDMDTAYKIQNIGDFFTILDEIKKAPAE